MKITFSSEGGRKNNRDLFNNQIVNLRTRYFKKDIRKFLYKTLILLMYVNILYHEQTYTC